MTVSSGFFNSVNHDRLYDAEQLSSIFDGIIIDGVYENYGDAFEIIPNAEANSSVIVKTGRAWFDHTWILNDSYYTIQLDPPNEMLSRVDAIVIDVNKETNTRKNSIIYLKGSESSPNTPPSLINNIRHNQYPLAYITRPAGSDSVISQSDIENQVGLATPIATGYLEAQNLENLWLQLDNEFNTWWDGVKATLDENTVTNLQNQINEINEKLNSSDSLVGLLEKDIAERFMSGNYNITSGKVALSNCSGQFPLASILPDGKIIIFNAGTVYIYNSSGILSKSQNVIPTTGDSNFDRRRGVIFLTADADSYPVNILFACVANNTNTSGTNKCIAVKVTIDASNVISTTSTDIVEQSPSESGSATPSITANTFPNGNGDFLVGYHNSGDYGTTNHSWTVWKITSSGAIAGSMTTPYYNSGNGSTGIHLTTVVGYGEEDFIVTGNTISDGATSITSQTTSGSNVPVGYSIIKGSDLSITYHNGDGVTTNFDKPYFSYNMFNDLDSYSLSEKNGVRSSHVDQGSLVTTSKQVSTEKVRNYFLGASNLGEPLPEGNFFAFKNSLSKIYGIGPNSEYIAIGTNGGAAILKHKAPSVQSFDINSIGGWHRSYLLLGNRALYLQVAKTAGAVSLYYIVKE